MPEKSRTRHVVMVEVTVNEDLAQGDEGEIIYGLVLEAAQRIDLDSIGKPKVSKLILEWDGG
jgi:hypothetical protein